MPKLIRLHWDFFGPDARKTAEHFLEHVDQFCAKEKISGHQHWVRDETIRFTAIVECDEQYLLPLRDALKPVRGERVLDQ